MLCPVIPNEIPLNDIIMEASTDNIDIIMFMINDRGYKLNHDIIHKILNNHNVLYSYNNSDASSESSDDINYDDTKILSLFSFFENNGFIHEDVAVIIL